MACGLDKTRAVIFDFDGVIADTETLHFATFCATLGEEGIDLGPDADNARFLGGHDRACFEIVLREAGRPASPELLEDLVERKSRRYRDGLADVVLFPGVRKLIDAAARRGPYTIASGARRADLAGVLAHHGLLDRFPRFVSGDDVVAPKPSPEAYLQALELLRSSGAPDLTPDACLVFEDSPRGVAAAKNADMWCVAVTNSSPAADLAGADRIVSSLEGWTWC